MSKNLKHFDIKAALNGEPVMLRNGQKAFVRHHETELRVGSCWEIWGIEERVDGSTAFLQWSVSGVYDMDGVISDLDIIGMYPTSKLRIINGFEVPAPETTEPDYGTAYFTPSLAYITMAVYQEWRNDDFDTRALKRGIVFLNEEDAIANAKAMLGINPRDEESEE
jgi:hypothetical protein